MRLLVVEGNDRATSDSIVTLGGRAYSGAYAALLHNLSDGAAACTIVYPSEQGRDCLPTGTRLSEFDGAVWTGSAMSVYENRPEVHAQLDLARECFDNGVPVFGSCWGLQVGVTALGGKVRANPKGMEFGIAKRVTVTERGADHPMFAGKAHAFEAFAVHRDETEALPAGAEVLASNDMSDVQAIAVERGGISFWGVQYHPEFDFKTMAVTGKRLRKRLLRDHVFPSGDALDETVTAFESLQTGSGTCLPDGEPIGEAVFDEAIRRREIANWLHYLERR
jgi:GMP synthase (glutamine-hydrolysing)